MEKWNTSERAIGPEDCPTTGLFCGIKEVTSRKGNKFKVVAIDTKDGSVWLPVFKVGGANIALSEVEKHKNSTVEVSSVKDMFVLEFKPL